MRRVLIFTILLTATGAARAEDTHTESRMPHLHNIPLHDIQGRVISVPPLLGDDGKEQDPKAPPYSTEETCGKCHDYPTISQGWHFNAAAGVVKPGRPGEPWLLTDAATHTQIPLSYRGWKGTFKPSQIGLNDYDFLTNFARQMPGGGIGEPAEIDKKDPRLGRMQITGKLEIDCLICHQTSGRYDYEGRFNAIRAQEFRWAPTIGATLGTFASFRTAGAIADQWHPGRNVPAMLPSIKYDRSKFDAENNVIFQVADRAPNANCYFCHTTETKSYDARWHSDGDIHLRAGLLCVDCHRNGLSHMIVRGYENERQDRAITPEMVAMRAQVLQRDDLSLSDASAHIQAQKQLESEVADVDTLSCAGCHTAGRLGAPRLVHRGLPPIHLRKLTCTACHSGPLPGPAPDSIHTSMAHKLGLPAPARGTNTAPVIVEPVFLYGADGKLGPYKMVWPSYWARRQAGQLRPLLPAEVAKSATLPTQDPDDVARDPYYTKPLADSDIQAALQSLAGDSSSGEPVFIAAGKLYHLDNGKLASAEDPAAAPYSWALAHDVRPAREALGAKGCADCHSSQSPIFFATVTARGPVAPSAGVAKPIWKIRGDNETWARAFAFSFLFRTWLKCVIIACAILVALVLLRYTLLGIGLITDRK